MKILLLILQSCFLIFAKDEKSISSNYTEYELKNQEILEEDLSIEYGNLILKQKINNQILYIYYLCKNNEEFFTQVIVNEKNNIISIKKKRKKTLFSKKNRYNPIYKFTTSITTTNNEYLQKKFINHIIFNAHIMNNMCFFYILTLERDYVTKYEMFKPLVSIFTEIELHRLKKKLVREIEKYIKVK
jgi:hypothetical protein